MAPQRLPSILEMEIAAPAAVLQWGSLFGPPPNPATPRPRRHGVYSQQKVLASVPLENLNFKKYIQGNGAKMSARIDCGPRSKSYIDLSAFGDAISVKFRSL